VEPRGEAHEERANATTHWVERPMSDIFLSFSSADRDRARQLAELLERQGWSVWWDRTIPPGSSFDQVIEQALRRGLVLLTRPACCSRRT
jgi:hypothetical protein